MKNHIGTFFKGMGMGAADIVPGVSGGTIAFITGIYEQLLQSLQAINLATLRQVIRGDFKGAWDTINGTFLLALFAGILVSVGSLVKLIAYLLEHEQVLLWSFFFGLIVASALVIGRKIKAWSMGAIVAMAVGIGIAVYISLATPAQTPDALWFVFLSGAIAICAMILPGISGSFILLLLRKYAFIVEALKTLDIVTILVFMAGCAVGLLSFARLLSWMFKRFHDLTIALLTGFMLGSLNMVWPWKKVIEYRMNSAGEEVPFRYESVTPNAYVGDPQLLFAIALAVVAFALIYLLERMANKTTNV